MIGFQAIMENSNLQPTLFELLACYELVWPDSRVYPPLRFEVLRAVDDASLYRARVWLKTRYNVYPSSMNTGSDGGDLRRVHSADELNAEITSLLADDSAFFTGMRFATQDAFVGYLRSKLESFVSSWCSDSQRATSD